MTRTRSLAAPMLAAAFAALAALPTDAQTLCSAPIAPICVDVATTYDDATTKDRCRQDLERYSDAVDDHTACLREQIEELNDHRDTLEAFFACRSEGGTDCESAPTVPGQ